MSKEAKRIANLVTTVFTFAWALSSCSFLGTKNNALANTPEPFPTPTPSPLAATTGAENNSNLNQSQNSDCRTIEAGGNAWLVATGFGPDSSSILDHPLYIVLNTDGTVRAKIDPFHWNPRSKDANSEAARHTVPGDQVCLGK